MGNIGSGQGIKSKRCPLGMRIVTWQAWTSNESSIYHNKTRSLELLGDFCARNGQ
jgi:hypothetical protein